MEQVGNDSELAHEMIKLLGSELKAVRQQLREFQAKDSRANSEISVAENATLKDENAELRRQLGDLRFRLDAALESEEAKLSHFSNSAAYDQVCVQLSEVLVERERKEQEHIEEKACLEEKVATYRDKYKKNKESKERYKNTLSELRQQLEEVVTQRDAAGKDARITADENSSSPFNALEFLSTPKGEPAQPLFDSISPFLSTPRFVANKWIDNMCARDGYLSFNQNEIVWSDDGIQRCLTLSLIHHYNHKRRGRTWENPRHNIIGPGQVRDLFYMQDRQWYYCGTFECVGSISVSAELVSKFGPNYLDYLQKSVVRNQELVPPLISNMVHNMLTEGVLPIRCCGFRRIGFNSGLDRELHARAEIKNINNDATTPAPREWGSVSKGSKRMQEGDDTSHPSKKWRSS
ncbi:hypothetical protein AcV5_004408 [Taiwanofungus camphoratus]|nr:hypothetical protein AcV5_004408 [Antrodia cinnamomea]KAI0961425.1 hypothetical protein AcV7_000530 [Antrodia cinnamomea]